MEIKEININFTENLIYPSEIFKKRILDRSHINVCFNNECEYNVDLKIDENYEKDYKLENFDNKTIITGSSFINLIAGIGKFLHNTKYYNDYIIPFTENFEIKPECEYRCVYFANHFYNYYQLASDETIKTYMEDLALWGYNVVNSILLPTLNLFGKDDKNVDWFIKCVKRIYNNTKALGMKYTAGSIANGDFKNFNKEIEATQVYDPHGSRGWTGKQFCPNKPGAIEYARDLFTWILDKCDLKEIDYFIVWPYDEGGCSCEKCYPWVPNGLMDLFHGVKDITDKRYPNIKYILALWRMIDDDNKEWSQTVDYLNKSNEFEYIMLNNELSFEQFPVHNHIPGKKINFTEISMWCFMPWGGFGANPFPDHIKELLYPCIDELQGCILYSEGPFEDINKVLCSYVLNQKDFLFKDILREYITYEFSHELVEDITELIMTLEKIHRDYGFDSQKLYHKHLCHLVKELSEEINNSPNLRNNWRWRVLYIRAQTEESRIKYLAEHQLENWNWETHVKYAKEMFSERELNLLKELNDIYEFSGKYTGIDSDNHRWLAPPVE